ncbi:glyoxylate/hydroxypyruvate reductase A [Amphritea sp. 1_MG-2023]|uniref:2-hydroxyacid dehydrogenase n=1 Tax=Amphritea sp. 1_MG-2023 TaxID=3062670 RepID=UPI0026E3EAD7|nr:glyoxylate/hydroxypyruvate reductase A [Amphritea sp. 1_MG-2023]MDO6563186.1 glyoxylate/hydroxypyruvate reductase A [Amphritea sp. 1_MG-2023]
MAPYLTEFDRYADEVSVVTCDQAHDASLVTFALLWYPEDDFFDRYPNVRVVASIAAGVDSILACPSIRDDVIVCRNRDAEQASIMSTFAIWNVINHQRCFAQYRQQQEEQVWQRLPMRAPSEVNVGVLGLGFMGEKMVNDLYTLGFDVAGWRKSDKRLDNSEITVFSGDAQLASFLQRTEVLICVLPLTPQTQGILSAELFAQLKPNAYLIQLGRGGHLITDDLLRALDDGSLTGASLDVFDEEPLPSNSPFWQHPRILVTPHDASDVRPQAAVENLVEEVRRFSMGEMPNNKVEPARGY